MGDMQGAIRLTVRTALATDIPTVNRLPIDWQPREDAYACLEMADAGCGIAIEDIEKLFDPFFSSKFTGRGLGLSVALGIVLGHHGAMSVESKPGRGSVFRVFLPVSAEAVPRKPVQAAPNPDSGRGWYRARGRGRAIGAQSGHTSAQAIWFYCARGRGRCRGA